VVALAIAASGLAGCVAYTGGARPVDLARLNEPGWITAADTPEIRQRSASDCGPATLAMIAARWDVPFSLDEAVGSVPEPSERGIRLGDLRLAARARGLDAYAISADAEILAHELGEGRPVILGLLLRHGKLRVRSHYEIAIGIRPETEEIVTIDPAAGYRIRTLEDLEEEWEPAGHPALVVLGPTHADSP
jgi:ABC-type bacteriocin/lantibiotic exporter with double-glycine peptidase domain